MADLDTLRPEVRAAINRQDRQEKCDEYCPVCEDRATIRAELLRLADENARLNKIESLATEQRLQMEDVELYLMDVSQPDDEDAPWCDRMKSAIELLVQDCNYAVGQKNKAEAELAAALKANRDCVDHFEQMQDELAALKERIAGGIDMGYPVECSVGSKRGRIINPFTPPAWIGKRVRLVVEE